MPIPLGLVLLRFHDGLLHGLAPAQGALRADKETVVRGIGRTLEERLRIETEMMMSMWLRKDRHSAGAQAFLDKNLKPEWPNHGL